MHAEGFRVTALYEADHWWFRSRRDLFLLQVSRAARDMGFPDRPLKLLDFGCGTAFNLSFLRQFGEVYGADRFRSEDQPFRRHTEFPLLDVERDLAGHEGEFDVVTALDVLEHLDDDVDGLRSLRRLLAPGGQIVLTVPAYDWLWSGEDVISDHRRRYTRAALLRACEAAGLEVQYASYFNLMILPLVAAVVWAGRLRPSSAGPQSNLWMPPRWLNEALYRVTSREASWIGTQRASLPAGASIICRVRGED
jgi:SAM-dependent methyltransferase